MQPIDLPDASRNLKNPIILLFCDIVSLSMAVTMPKRLVQKGAGLEKELKSDTYNDAVTVIELLITLACVLLLKRVIMVLCTLCMR